jgi:hypothetical protein
MTYEEGYKTGWHEAMVKVCESLGQHDWDCVDMTDSEGGEANEYCARCGLKR